MATRKKVEIPNEAWLDTFKFLMGLQCQKVRFVSRQLAEVLQENISELPRIRIDEVKFWETTTISSEIVASGISIPPNEKREWFMKRGINLDTPASLQHQDVFIGIESKDGYVHKPSIFYYADVNELGGESKTIRSKREMTWQKMDRVFGKKYQDNREPQNPIFSAAFIPKHNEYSWASMKYFLKLLYNPLTYVKEIEMWALNKNFFLEDDYDSYIHCGTFTLIGDLRKSLPWVQTNVRADTIYLPGDFTDVKNSYKEVCNSFLGTPWICANQTRNVKIEWIHNWKWFIKFLIKKFQSLIITEHATPSIKFSFLEAYEKNIHLNFLIWDPEVVKLQPEDSQDAKAAYMISNGRNRMAIEIFKSRERYLNTRYDVSIKTYTIKQAAPSQNTFHIGNDTWLEALKFLLFPQWSKVLFVSRQFAKLVQRNISRLPYIVLDSATVSEKFETISFVRNDIPMITATTYGNYETMSFLPSDSNVLKLKPQDSEGADVYVIFNGDNRMQIKIVKRYNCELSELGYEDSDNDSSSDDSEDEDVNLVNDDDGLREKEKQCFIDVNVKLYTV